MPTVLIAALVAAVVSLFGLLISLHIARLSARSAIRNLRVGSALKSAEDGLKAITRFCSVTEHFRLTCCQLSSRLHLLVGETWYCQDDCPPDRVHAVFGEAKEAFCVEYPKFLEAWSDGRISLHDDARRIIGGFLHDSKNIHVGIRFGLETVSQELTIRAPEQMKELMEASGVMRGVAHLIGHLEELYAVAAKHRNAMIADLLTNDRLLTTGRTVRRYRAADSPERS